MLKQRRITRWMHVATLVALASLTMTACGDDPAEPEQEPEIDSIVVTSGTSSVTIPATGSHTGTLQLKVNTANTISVVFKNSAGADEPVITAERANFECRLTVGTTTQTFTGGTGATFSGTVTPTATGTAAYTLVLFHLEEGHAEVTKTLSVTIVP